MKSKAQRIVASSDTVATAVAVLREGKLVALPTETVYGIAVRADSRPALQNLLRAKERADSHPFTLAFSSVERIMDIAPEFSVSARRLASRVLPGPLTMVLRAREERARRFFPQDVWELVLPNASFGARVPRDDFSLKVLESADFPIALTSANLSGRADCTSVEEVVHSLSDRISMIVDHGDSPLRKPSTVVRLREDGSTWDVLREGAISRTTLRRLAAPLILFVCSGNTCRSPLAEGIARQMLAELWGVAPEDVEELAGVFFLSAGVRASQGASATSFARRAAEKMNLDISLHFSMQVTLPLLEYADWVCVMTPEHKDALLELSPKAASKISILAEEKGGVRDPFGASQQEYDLCALEIRSALEKEWARPEFRSLIPTPQPETR
ncbi:MAG: L-threonylcarbamoyladenylate synthase [Planctomycetia bacterium]|nr:L-threonylcarbamoyladenylate synthase [Planctomycetia bacterium]